MFSRCLAGRQVHEWAFSYLEDFWKSYPLLPKFSTLMLIEGHENTGHVVSSVDSGAFLFFQNFLKFVSFSKSNKRRIYFSKQHSCIHIG